MNSDDIRVPCNQMRDAFVQLTQAYSAAAGHLGELDLDVDTLVVQFDDAWAAVGMALADYDVESDEITEAIYEDALTTEEPWALEAFEARRS